MNTLLEESQVNELASEKVSRLVVALSGGADSVALLAMVHELNQASIKKPLMALHINHDIADEAGAWQCFCETWCAELGVPFSCMTVKVDRNGSLEGNARAARYAAFEQILQTGDLLLLAHHADDQVETILFNLFRGSGAFGVRGMPDRRRIGSAWLYRPLIAVSGDALRDYCLSHQLKWIEDGSNQDLRFDRNFLRHDLLPRIRERFAAADAAILRADSRDREYQRVIDVGTRRDLAESTRDSIGLSLTALREFDPFRIVMLLRCLAEDCGVPLPGTKQLKLCARMIVDKVKSTRLISWQGYSFSQYRESLFLVRDLPDAFNVTIQIDSAKLGSAFEIGVGVGRLVGFPMNSAQGIAAGSGIDLKLAGQLSLRFRRGGEKLMLSKTRSLKNLFQENGVPSWLRDHVPLIYQGDRLVAVPAIPAWHVSALVSPEVRAVGPGAGIGFGFHVQDRVDHTAG